MAYQTTVDLLSLEGRPDFINEKGENQCVALVQRVTDAVRTAEWTQGRKVLDAVPGEIAQGTVIATFDENGKYPMTQRHAAIYVSHNPAGIEVYD